MDSVPVLFPSLSERIIHRYTAFRRSIEGIRVSPIRKEGTRSDASGRFSSKKFNKKPSKLENTSKIGISGHKEKAPVYN